MDRRREQDLGPGGDLCRLLADEANFAASELHQSWTRRDQDSQLSELKALWYGVHLVGDCRQALTGAESEGRGLRQRIIFHPDPETRYEVEAALTTIAQRRPTLEPYRLALARLTMSSEVNLDAMCQALREQEPSVVQAWHDWLWPAVGSARDHGDSSLFAIAASRLSRGMEAVLAADREIA
jgi:hypothetical protein